MASFLHPSRLDREKNHLEAVLQDILQSQEFIDQLYISEKAKKGFRLSVANQS